MGTNVAMVHHRARHGRRSPSGCSPATSSTPRSGSPISVIGGLIVGWALGKCAEYYTSDGFTPVKKIARQSETGPATTVLAGHQRRHGVGRRLACVLILVGVGVAYWGGQLAFNPSLRRAR